MALTDVVRWKAVRVFGTVLLAFLSCSSLCRAQYTDVHAIEALGGRKEFARRRQELKNRVKDGYVLLFARNTIPEATHYREDDDFFYYTGLGDPGAVMLIDTSTGAVTIFEPVQQGRTTQVYGPNLLSLSPTEREQLGYTDVQSVADLDITLSRLLGAGQPRMLWVRLGFPDKADGARPEVGRDHAWMMSHPYFTAIVSEDLAPVMLLRQRYPMAELRDLTPIVDIMRNIKTPAEIEVLRKNGKLSAEGVREAIAAARPNMFQYQIEARAYYVFYDGGAEGMAYPAIVGSGKNINTWHYFNNRNQILPNQLVVFDFAASLDHETMDITRTFNISGQFTPDQAKWYIVDLEAQKACIALLHPGRTYEEAADAGKAVYGKAGIGQQWRGFPGHFVGLATHDVMRPTGPIRAGQVVTVEPIVEFPEKQMHFRVEDTVLITNTDPEVLSSGVPKEMTEVEHLVGSSR